MPVRRLESPAGPLTLERRPEPRDPSLRAWDAADVLLLEYASEWLSGHGTVSTPLRILVVNDTFGALTAGVALELDSRGLNRAEAAVLMSWGDSCRAADATESNLAANDLVGAASVTTALDPPELPLDLIVGRMPRSHDLLSDQLHRLAPRIHQDTEVVFGAMTRHLHTAGLEIVESCIGPTHTSLAKRKARLVHPSPDGRDPGPTRWPTSPEGWIQHAGVFSAGRIDRGTALLLDEIRAPVDGERWVDLGCGDGAIGCELLERADIELLMIDESTRATASAAANALTHHPTSQAQVIAADATAIDSWGPSVSGSIDAIACNPPFHASGTRGDETALALFRTAHAALRPGGELWVVANRHLNHRAALARRYRRCETVGGNRRFTVMKAVR